MGSTQEPSIPGKIKVMTAECINLRTVPTARCMSRIGNGDDGSWAIQVGGLRSGLAFGGRSWITNISTSGGGGSSSSEEILKGETSLQAPTLAPRHNHQAGHS